MIRSSASLRLLALVAALLAMALTSCSSSNRPTVAEWTLTWEAANAAVPEASVLIEQGQDGACAEGLAMLRAMRGDLLPTPDAVLDEAVNEWVDIAEAALFECPETSDPTYETTFARLDRLGAEVQTVLDLDR